VQRGVAVPDRQAELGQAQHSAGALETSLSGE